MLSFYLSILETEEDKDRFEQLYRMFKQDMYAVAYGILKNKEDAEDVVHQSFLSLLPIILKKLMKFLVRKSSHTLLL